MLPSRVSASSFTHRHRPGCWPPRPPDQDGKLVLTQDDIDQELSLSGLKHLKLLKGLLSKCRRRVGSPNGSFMRSAVGKEMISQLGSVTAEVF